MRLILYTSCMDVHVMRCCRVVWRDMWWWRHAASYCSLSAAQWRCPSRHQLSTLRPAALSTLWSGAVSTDHITSNDVDGVVPAAYCLSALEEISLVSGKLALPRRLLEFKNSASTIFRNFFDDWMTVFFLNRCSFSVVFFTKDYKFGWVVHGALKRG